MPGFASLDAFQIANSLGFERLTSVLEEAFELVPSFLPPLGWRLEPGFQQQPIFLAQVVQALLAQRLQFDLWRAARAHGQWRQLIAAPVLVAVVDRAKPPTALAAAGRVLIVHVRNPNAVDL